MLGLETDSKGRERNNTFNVNANGVGVKTKGQEGGERKEKALPAYPCNLPNAQCTYCFSPPSPPFHTSLGLTKF
jgi:hypothetical protein